MSAAGVARPTGPIGGPDPLAMLTAYQQSAVIGAAVQTGVADGLFDDERTAEQLAESLGLHPGATRSLLGAMAALGLAERRATGAFALTEEGAPLAQGHPRTFASIVLKEWFFYRAWAGLPQSVRDGHARIPRWRERLRDDPEQSFGFLRALDDLASYFAGELPELAGIPGPGRLLDVGGGAGSHASALAAAIPGLDATVLDLPDVEPVLRERHPELRFFAGDLDAPRFGIPEGESWDYLLLANVLHDNPPEKCANLALEAAGLLRAGGRVVVYEWVLDDDRVSPPDVALFDLMMLVENEGGHAYSEGELTSWLQRAGLDGIEHRRGHGPISVIRAGKPA